MKDCYVYIMASKSQVIYIGITNDLARRVSEHKAGEVPGFTNRYRVNQLVYFERYTDVREAISREKVLKGWVRRKKVRLIESKNPDWKDLAVEVDSSLPPDSSSGLRPSSE